MVANPNNLIAIDLPGFGVRSDELVAADPLSKAAQEIATEIAAIGG